MDQLKLFYSLTHCPVYILRLYFFVQVLHQMKSEMRKKMEHEIEMFQEQLYRDEDDEYFRQIEADRLRHQLQVARQAAVL